MELSKTSLSEDNKREIIMQVVGTSKRGSPAYALLRARVVKSWSDLFAKDEVTAGDIAALKLPLVVVQTIVQTRHRLRRIFDVCILVHGDRFNGMIRSVVGSIGSI